MNDQEKAVFYLEKLRLYFIDIVIPMKHLQEVLDHNDQDTTDPNIIGLKAMCGNIYLCMYYINQISIVANTKELHALTKTIQKVFIKYKPLIDKLASDMGIQPLEINGVNIVNGSNTIH